jgi:hypothetical protein
VQSVFAGICLRFEEESWLIPAIVGFLTAMSCCSCLGSCPESRRRCRCRAQAPPPSTLPVCQFDRVPHRAFTTPAARCVTVTNSEEEEEEESHLIMLKR